MVAGSYLSFLAFDTAHLYPDPPAVDLSTSLFDPSEQQYLSGFFDNLVEDKNEFILPTGFDFSALLSSWNSLNFPPPHPKSQLPYGLQPDPNHSYYFPGTSLLSAPVAFHAPQPYPLPPDSYRADIYVPSAIKYPQPCEQLSSLSDSSSSTPHGSIGDQVAIAATNPGGFAPEAKLAPEVSLEQCAKIPRLKEPLKDDQRKANHIASEQKRRDIIRRGFESLSELIPGLKRTNCSRATVLGRAADYMHEVEGKILELKQKKAAMLAQLSAPTGSSPPAKLNDARPLP
ncbi:hypothetical protein L0F63_001657 [Massospora cicadina]|nr:hypothetical protein L0F63_001657 [Massospora cicadina]